MSTEETEIAPYAETASTALAAFGAIETDGDYSEIVAIQVEAKTQIANVKDSMKESISLAHQTHKALKRKENEAVHPLNEIVDITKRMMGDYQAILRKREAEADAEIKRLAQADAMELAKIGEVDAAQAVIAYEAPKTNYKPKGQSTITRTTYKVEVEDLDKVPREYMIADLAMIKKIATATKGKPIAGIKITTETNTTARMKG